jgi:hypothetical protein
MTAKVMEKCAARRVEILNNSSFNDQEKMLGLVVEGPSDVYEANLAEYKNATKHFNNLVGLLDTPSMKIYATRRAYEQLRWEDGQGRFDLMWILVTASVDGRAQITDARDHVFPLFTNRKEYRSTWVRYRL